MGGPRMVAAGFEAIKSSEELGVVGLIEVIKHLPRLFALVDELAQRAVERSPDVAVLIDSPDFNVRLSKRLKSAQIKSICYVGPSVWAWRAGRVKVFKRAFDRMMVLFPFETPIWSAARMDVVCVGHPLIDEIPRRVPWEQAQSKTVALLPGSRRSEIRRHLRTMLEVAKRLHNEDLAERFLLPVAPSISRSWLGALIEQSPAKGLIELVDGAQPERRRAAIAKAQLALVVSGTATLETALVGRPQVIFYRVNWLSYLIGKALMRVKHFGLPNIIAGREIAPELLQAEFHTESLFGEAQKLLSDRAASQALEAVDEMREKLGAAGAAERAADAVLQTAQGGN